jgi:predicted SprT family Zn-dependent metalloprotease
MRADCSGASLDRIRRMNRSAREAYLCSYCSARMEE